MYIPLWIVITTAWLILGFICGFKQYRVSNHDPVFFVALILAPFWFIGAVIRQVIIEDWK